MLRICILDEKQLGLKLAGLTITSTVFQF